MLNLLLIDLSWNSSRLEGNSYSLLDTKRLIDLGEPFDDVNKCVSRLAANVPLIKGNFCPLSFEGVPRETYTDAVLGVYSRRPPKASC